MQARISRDEVESDKHKEILESDIEDQADVPHIGAGQVLENGDEIQQLIVVSIREPAADRNSVLRVENVRGR